MYFRFNRNLDLLKKQINHHKKEDEEALNWFESRREQFLKFEICPHKKLEAMLKNYENPPLMSEFLEPKTKQIKDDR